MDLKELVEWKKKWQKENAKEVEALRDKDWHRYMLYMSTGLAGEVGEFANMIKKVERRRLMTKNAKIENSEMEYLKKEVVDIFAYLLAVVSALDMDLEKEFLKKQEEVKAKLEKIRNA